MIYMIKIELKKRIPGIYALLSTNKIYQRGVNTFIVLKIYA